MGVTGAGAIAELQSAVEQFKRKLEAALAQLHVHDRRDVLLQIGEIEAAVETKAAHIALRCRHAGLAGAQTSRTRAFHLAVCS